MSDLSKVLVNFFHIAPIFFIISFYAIDLAKSKYTLANSLLPSLPQSKKSMVTLFLSALGIAFGSTAHHCSHTTFDPCLFYAATIFVIAMKLGFAKRTV